MQVNFQLARCRMGDVGRRLGLCVAGSKIQYNGRARMDYLKSALVEDLLT